MASWQCMFDGERAVHSRGRGDAHQLEAGYGSSSSSSGSGLIVVLAGAGRREHVQGGKARQARQRR